MDALQQDRLDALVHDRPILRYLIAHAEEQGVHLLPLEFERQDYGIALPEQSPLREPINRALLDHIASETWRENQTRYLGEGS